MCYCIIEVYTHIHFTYYYLSSCIFVLDGIVFHILLFVAVVIFRIFCLNGELYVTILIHRY
jgi:hypothetical protein